MIPVTNITGKSCQMNQQQQSILTSGRESEAVHFTLCTPEHKHDNKCTTRFRCACTLCTWSPQVCWASVLCSGRFTSRWNRVRGDGDANDGNYPQQQKEEEGHDYRRWQRGKMASRSKGAHFYCCLSSGSLCQPKIAVNKSLLYLSVEWNGIPKCSSAQDQRVSGIVLQQRNELCPCLLAGELFCAMPLLPLMANVRHVYSEIEIMSGGWLAAQDFTSSLRFPTERKSGHCTLAWCLDSMRNSKKDSNV